MQATGSWGRPFWIVIACLASLIVSGVADASTLVRGYTPRYATTARGDLLVIGNTLMTCPTAALNCSAAQGGGSFNNNSFSMEWVNADNVTTSPQNSSTATLNIPGGSTVVFAGLYWGADTSSGGTGAAPTPASRDVVRFATPASGYANTTATTVDVSGTRFSAMADVTSRVQAGGSGTYKVAGIQAGRGADRYAGWSLVVVVTNPTLPPRNMVVFDGYATINSTAPTAITTSVSGFRTPPTGTVTSRVGFIAYEGDLDSTGDSFQVNGANLSNGLNPATNAFNSTISSGGSHFTAKSPNYTNQLGFDADLFDTTLLPNNATSATLTFTTGGETYFPAAILFSTLVFEPVIDSNFIKSVTDLNGGTVGTGDILEYTIAYGNTGNDGALQVVVTDAIPANTTYVPGSLQVVAGPNAGAKTDAVGDDQANFDSANNRVVFRLGTGANGLVGGTLSPGTSGSLRFRVQVNATAPQNAVIPNTAQTAYVSASLNEAKTADSNTVSVTVSNLADVSVVKTASAAQVVAGQAMVFTLTINNAGPAAANGTILRDPAVANLECAAAPAPGSATCEGTSGALCPGGVASGPIAVSALQSAGGVVLPTLPAGGRIVVEMTCVPASP
jgi:uncharacterized repeat protein (TIGR01451 family)